MPKIAKRIQHPGSKGAFEIWEKGMALEAAGYDIIHLEIGEPDFETPLPILDEAERAMRAGRTTYSHPAGTPGLRQAAAEYLSSTRQIDALPENVLIGAGVKELLFFAAMGLMEPGDDLVELQWFSREELQEVKQMPEGIEFFVAEGYMDQPQEGKEFKII